MKIKTQPMGRVMLGSMLLGLTSVGFAADDGSQMNDKFRVNFAGYMPQAEKIGLYLSSNQGPVNWSLSGSDCSGSEDTYVSNDKSSGDSFYIIDFSECTKPGTNLRLSVGGQSSAAFDISDDPYGNLKYEFFDYFKDHETSATFNQAKNNWANVSASFSYVKDAGDNGAYPTNTAEAAWALINMLETYPAINTYYSANFSGAKTVYDQLLVLTDQFNHVLNNPTKLAIAKFHTHVNGSWAACSPHSGGTCISEPETKATFATARTMAAMARIHASFGSTSDANTAYNLAKTAYTNAKNEPFRCNQADAFGGEGGMYPDNDNTSLWRDPKSDRDNCVPDRNNTEDDEYASIVELYIAAEKLGKSADAAQFKPMVTSHSRFNEASSYWWGAVVMEANLSLLSNEGIHSIDMSSFKANLVQKANAIYAQSAKGYPGVTWDPNSDQWNSGDKNHIDNNVRWGSHRMALNDARIMMAAAEVASSNSDKARLARGAVKVLDHIAGINAINLAMFTASGYNNIEHAVSRTHDGANPGDSWAGKMILGPNNWTNANDGDMPAFGSQPGLKMFALTGTGWSSREVSIDANAALVPVAYFADQVAPDLFMLAPYGTPPADNVPAMPTALSAGLATANSIALSWTDNAGDNNDAEQGYRLFVSTGTNKPAAAVKTVSSNVTSTVITGLTPLTNYTFWVEAFNAVGTSSADVTSGATIDGPAAVNLIDNGDFAAGTSAWTCELPAGSAQCSVINGAFNIAISNGGSATWHVQPQQGGIALVGGQTYTFAFDAKASANRTAEIKVERPVSPWEDFSNIGGGQSLTTTMQRFSYTFTMPESVADTRVVMNIGNSNNDVTVDNIWLVEGTDDPCNGIVGCESSPVDTDGDGFNDDVDACPLVAGVAPDGCPAQQTDTDGDGVLDNVDNCPLVKGPASNNGCPLPIEDRDGDGIADADDNCPDQAGPASNNGCPLPKEEGLSCVATIANDWGSGGQYDVAITNTGSTTVNGWKLPVTFDRAIEVTNFWNVDLTGSGANYEASNGKWNGTVSPGQTVTFGFQVNANDGLTIPECGDSGPVDDDWDNDGVTNAEDECPNTAGPASNNGCPVVEADFDNDGVVDSEDDCPTVPGPASNNGCPLVDEDFDKDGVVDQDDACPTVPGPASNNGCPLQEAVKIRLQAEDYDRYNDFTLGNEGGACRNDDVDIENTTDIGGGCNVGWTSAGEWLEFDLSNVAPGSYTVVARVASQFTAGLSVNGVSGTFSNSQDWQDWKDLTLGQISLAGDEVIRITFETDSVNLNYIDLLPPCDGSASCTDTDDDGIMDDVDQCPNQFGLAPDGCPVEEGITAAMAVAEMGKGFNLGQMFDYTDGPIDFGTSKAKIDAYYALGFRNVRLPITWTEKIHGNYLADPATGVVNRGNSRLQTIEQIVDYALSLDGMYVIINMHHEYSIKNHNKWWLVEQVWADAADIFQNRSSKLLFEILNEPHKDQGGMATADVRNLTGKAYDKIRAISPQRIIIIGGNEWFHANELAATWPHLNEVGGGSDPYVMATFHHYNPWTEFHSEDTWPKTFDFSDHTIRSQMDIVQNWANSVGGMPILIGEWGVGWGKHRSAMTCNNIRLWYTKMGVISAEEGMATSVWDDGGWFKIFDNHSKSFNNNLANCVGEECNWDPDFTRFNSGCF